MVGSVTSREKLTGPGVAGQGKPCSSIVPNPRGSYVNERSEGGHAG